MVAHMEAREKAGKRIRIQIICRYREQAAGLDVCTTLGEMITLSSPTVAGARYIRRRLEELAAELHGMIIVPDDLPADPAASQCTSRQADASPAAQSPPRKARKQTKSPATP